MHKPSSHFCLKRPTESQRAPSQTRLCALWSLGLCDGDVNCWLLHHIGSRRSCFWQGHLSQTAPNLGPHRIPSPGNSSPWCGQLHEKVQVNESWVLKHPRNWSKIIHNSRRPKISWDNNTTVKSLGTQHTTYTSTYILTELSWFTKVNLPEIQPFGGDPPYW